MADNENKTESQKTQQEPECTRPPKSDEETKREELENAQNEVIDKEGELKALQEKLADIKQAKEKYATFYSSWNEKYIKSKATVDNQIKEAKVDIHNDDLISKIDKEINDTIFNVNCIKQLLEDDIKKAKENLKSYQVDASEKEAKYQTAMSDFNTVKNLPKVNETSLNELTALINETEKAHDAANYRRKYLLASISQKALIDEIKEIIPPDSYNKTLGGSADVAYNARVDAEQAINQATINRTVVVSFLHGN